MYRLHCQDLPCPSFHTTFLEPGKESPLHPSALVDLLTFQIGDGLVLTRQEV